MSNCKKLWNVMSAALAVLVATSVTVSAQTTTLRPTANTPGDWAESGIWAADSARDGSTTSYATRSDNRACNVHGASVPTKTFQTTWTGFAAGWRPQTVTARWGAYFTQFLDTTINPNTTTFFGSATIEYSINGGSSWTTLSTIGLNTSSMTISDVTGTLPASHSADIQVRGRLTFGLQSCTNTTSDSSYVSGYIQINDIRVDALPRQLTLFLDVDGNFNPSAAASDQAAFVPGSDSNRASVAVPQSIQVIAAYADDLNGIFAPLGAGDVSFVLSNVSKYKGIAMNASHAQRGDDDLDFVLGNPADSESTQTSYTNTTTSLSVAFSGTDNTARVNSIVWDYGGHATVTATHNSTSSSSLGLPADTNGNGIAESGWLATKRVSGVSTTAISDDASASADSDSPPSGGFATGDGLTRFEEYRGFFVNGAHIRTDPATMDLFVNSDSGSIGDADALAFSKWKILTGEMATNRGINYQYQNTGDGGDISSHFAQKALTLITSQGSTSYYGYADTTTMYPAPPANVYAVYVYKDKIRSASPPTASTTTPETFDDDMIASTSAHEVGHGVSLIHPTSSQCPQTVVTVMVTQYFPITTNTNDCAWTHIPHVYDSSDMASLQLR